MLRIDEFSYQQCSGTWTQPLSAIACPSGHSLSIVGPSNSGKTAFCLAICGLSAGFKTRGAIELDGYAIASLSEHQRARDIAYIPTEPSLLFSGVKSTLRGEFQLNVQWLRSLTAYSEASFGEVIEKFDLQHLLDRDPFSLSGGEATRAAIAIAIAKRPRLIVIDQGFDSFDHVTVAKIRRLALSFLPASIFVQTFAREPEWLKAVDGSSEFRPIQSNASKSTGWRCRHENNSETIASTVATDGLGTAPLSPEWQPAGSPKREGLLNVQNLEFAYDLDTYRLGPIDLEVQDSDILALVGQNGVGKTTLLRSLALLIEPSYTQFSLCIGGNKETPPKPSDLYRWAAKATYCFQNPDDQIYLPTVRAELSETAKRAGRFDPSEFSRVADHFGLTQFLDQSPSELPRPYRRITCIAGAILAKPPLLLLDEPSAGLDQTQLYSLAEALFERRLNHGASILVTHDQELIRICATRVVEMNREGQRGRIVRQYERRIHKNTKSIDA